VLVAQMELLKPMAQKEVTPFFLVLHLLAVVLVMGMQRLLAVMAALVVVVTEGLAVRLELVVLEIHQALHLLKEIMAVMAIYLLDNAVAAVVHPQ
jgi:hypothetical protein